MVKRAIVISIILMCAALLIYIILGTNARMMADDYCSAYEGLQSNVIDNTIMKYQTWSARYSTYFMLYLLAPLQPGVHSWFPALTIIMWFGVAAYTLSQIFAHLKIQYRSWHLVAGAIIFTYISYRLMMTYQLAFWLSAVISHTWPALLTIFFCGTLLHYFRQPRSNRTHFLFLFWVAAAMPLISGFVETQVIFLGIGFGLLLLATPFVMPAYRRNYLSIVGIALVALIISLGIIVASPGTAIRQERLATIADLSLSPFEALPIGLLQTVIFFFMDLTGTNTGQTEATLYLLLLFLVILISGIYYLRQHQDITLPGQSISPRLFWVATGIGFLLIFAILYPTAYAAGRYVPRGTLIVRLIEAGIVSAWAYVLLLEIQKRHLLPELRKSKMWSALLGVIALFFIGVTTSSIVRLWQLVTPYQTYAQSWDARHQMLSNAPAGHTVVTDELDFNVADYIGLETPTDDPYFWVNTCVADYYNLDAYIVDDETIDTN